MPPASSGMNFDIEWESGNSPQDMIDSLSTLNKVADLEFYRVVQETKDDVVEVAQDRVPVDTGKLQGSIDGTVRTRGDNIVFLVGSPVEYAAYVELGTSNMSAQPYLRPALEQATKSFDRKVAEAVERAAGEV